MFHVYVTFKSYFQILDSIGVFLLCSITEAEQYKNMMAFTIGHDISSFTRLELLTTAPFVYEVRNTGDDTFLPG